MSKAFGVVSAPIVNRYCVDESGHSGDMAGTRNVLDFLDQPFFVLAAVGMPEGEQLASLSAEVDALRVAHRLPPTELKSKSLQSKPKFVVELLEAVLERGLPFFLEVVDKRYFVGTNLVEFVLLPPIMGFEEGPHKHFIRNQFAELVYEEVSDDVLQEFARACAAPSHDALMSVFEGLREACREELRDPNNLPFMAGLEVATKHVTAEYLQLREDDERAFQRFLPPTDLNRFGKPVSMLPNQTCFTNICARINRSRGGNMSGVRIIHDEQLETANILCDSKLKLEQIKATSFRPYTPFADYLLDGEATLEFASSHQELGIQLADVLAGTAMRFYRELTREQPDVQPAIARLIGKLLLLSDRVTSCGVNLVGPDKFFFSAEDFLDI